MNAQQLGQALVNPFSMFDPSLFYVKPTIVIPKAGVSLIVPYSSRRIFLHIFPSASGIPVSGSFNVGGAGPEAFYENISVGTPFVITWQTHFALVQQEWWNLSGAVGSTFNVFEVEWNHPKSRGYNDATRKLETIASQIPGFIRPEWSRGTNSKSDNTSRPTSAYANNYS